MIVITLLGPIVGKARPRFVRATGIAFTPAKSRTYDENLGAAAGRVMAGRPPLSEALAVYVLAVFPIPQSWSAKKRAAALSGEIRPCVKPDGDNILKQLDALQGIVFVDDKNIVDARIKKIYGDRPRLVVTVAAIGEAKSDRPANSPQLPLPDAPGRTADA